MTAYNFTNLQAQSPYVPGHTFRVAAYFELTTGLGSGDTITALNLIPPDGVTILSALVYFPRLDTNGTPTGTFELGDDQTDGNAADRFIVGASLGGASTTSQVHVYANVPPSFSNGVQLNGVGYFYADNENTPLTNNGYFNMVMTVTAGLATAASSGLVVLEVDYLCVGNI
jgi:hypothetical protein